MIQGLFQSLLAPFYAAFSGSFSDNLFILCFCTIAVLGFLTVLRRAFL